MFNVTLNSTVLEQHQRCLMKTVVSILKQLGHTLQLVNVNNALVGHIIIVNIHANNIITVYRPRYRTTVQ